MILMMETSILRINPEDFRNETLREPVRILREGGVIVYPTETFYGLGVSAFSRSAIARVYSLKGREFNKPLSLVVSDLDMLHRVTADIPPSFSALAPFWPGPLTLVFRAASGLPDEMLGRNRTVAVRIPGHAWVRRLLVEADLPVTATSANLTGEKEISDPQEAIRLFSGKVDLIVDGGPTPGGRPSTVIDLTSERPAVLREGAIPISRLAGYIVEDNSDR